MHSQELIDNLNKLIELSGKLKELAAQEKDFCYIDFNFFCQVHVKAIGIINRLSLEEAMQK